ncbi:NAD(P)/FAD-dependent oxidoreductase [Streptomyces sp. HNM0574]|nr:NAD(P)/FAD-dependent oxidoreductase [Streptomyces sp. HNM0574]
MLHELRANGYAVHVFETGSGVGGTWYWNRYPGARCDVESINYSYSFSPELEQEWDWSERFATQPEILRYAEYVADRFDLRRDISFNTPVESAVFDDEAGIWTLTTGAGGRSTARFLVTAVGCLSASRIPDFPGLDSFTGAVYHTGRWPHGPVDFSGKRVGVVGTGSSGIQAIPPLAEEAERLTVFQRTPNFTVPARNRPLGEEERREVKRNYRQLREQARNTPSGQLIEVAGKSAVAAPPEEVTAELERRWRAGGNFFVAAYADVLTDERSNRLVAEFVREKIRETVSDPVTAGKLSPTNHPIAAKRICVDTGYYETFNRPDVDLVDVRENPITEITPRGIRTTAGEHALDAIVFATGYDAMTGPLTRIDIRGSGGVPLAERWAAEGPRTYLGLAVAGFPNLFTITGPGSPSVLANVIMSIEQHVEWITGHLGHLRANGLTRSVARADAQDAWVEHVNKAADATLYPEANSWYLGANIPGKPRVFMPYVGGLDVYRKKCDEVAAGGYTGFALSGDDAS